MSKNVKEIVAKLSLEKKAAMCSGLNFWNLEPVEEFDIPPVMVSDGPCGLRKQSGAADNLGINESIRAISFPTGAVVASSYDRELMKKWGETLAEECHAENLGVVLGPAMNIKRSPLCGRNFEYFSEDPYVSGELASEYIMGVQSKNVGVSVKHFMANNQENRRMTASSNMDERTMREIYLAGFEKAVKKAKPWTMMSCYNRLNGKYVGEDHRILTEILRDEWGFDGYVMSDWGAVNDRVAALKAGLDLEMPASGQYNTDLIIKAVKDGTLDESVIDTACERMLTISLRYLENHYEAEFDYEGDHNTAQKMAEEGIVLLKNEDKILPLKEGAKIAFIGEFAEKPRFQGGGSSHVNSYKVTSPLEAAEGLNVTYAKGFIAASDKSDEALLAEAVETAKAADVAVLFVGIPDILESEGYERRDMKLPPNEVEVIEKVAAAQPNTVVIVHCGGCVEMPWLSEVKGVLYPYLAGEALGKAEINILTGAVNPSGKLTETFPIRLEDNPSYLWYGLGKDNADYNEGIYVGYRYYDKKKMPVLFPFGYGLSYTTFEYSDLKVSADEIKDTDGLTVSVKVKNTGDVFGKEVVELYVRNFEGIATRPVREIKGFEKVALNPGEEKEVTFELDKRSFAYWNTEMNDWVAETGVYGIEIGKSSRDIVLSADVKVESTGTLKPVFTINSTIGDIVTVPAGQQLFQQMFAQYGAGMENGDAPGDAGLGSDMLKMVMDMPLRGLAMLGGMTMDQVHGIVAMLNQ